jgi:hypothetical protein
MDELQRLEELKAEAVANPPKKKKGCSDCKKKAKEVKQVVLPDPFEGVIYVPSVSDIRKAYLLLNNTRGINPMDKPFINKVYVALFNEEFDFNCSTCVSRQSMKYYNYCKDKKII